MFFDCNRVEKKQTGGTFYYDGVLVGHTVFEIEILINIVDIYNPDIFVEIGIHEGGLSYVLMNTFPEMNYLGIEIDCGIPLPEVRGLFHRSNATLVCEDCFDKAVIKRVRNSKGRKLIYCDGGNKAKEIKVYKSVISVGDIIMCHDYWDGKSNVFDVPRPNAEVTPKDIKMYEIGGKYRKFSFPGTRILGYRRMK